MRFDMSEWMLRTRSLCRTYASGSRSIHVLKDLDLDVEAGESVGIVGDSGVGKSTLLHLLGGIDRPEQGSLEFNGKDLVAADRTEIAHYRNQQVGFVFQFHHLLPEFTALENVEMPFRIAGTLASVGDRPREILEQLGLADRVHHLPGQLSGGEQQRVAIARAVAPSPALVLADEPTGNLDPATGARVFEMLEKLQRKNRFSLILATHSSRLAGHCDRVLRLTEGRLVALDAAAQSAYFRADHNEV
jgi:lipoprotein-releasing system ATP-binding protein